MELAWERLLPTGLLCLVSSYVRQIKFPFILTTRYDTVHGPTLSSSRGTLSLKKAFNFDNLGSFLPKNAALIWTSSKTGLTLPQEFWNFWETFTRVQFFLELLEHFFGLVHQILVKKCRKTFGFGQPFCFQKFKKNRYTKSVPKLLDCFGTPPSLFWGEAPLPDHCASQIVRAIFQQLIIAQLKFRKNSKKYTLIWQHKTAKYSFYIFRSADGNMISMSLYDNIFLFLQGYYSETLFTKHSGNSTAYIKGRSRVLQES